MSSNEGKNSVCPPHSPAGQCLLPCSLPPRAFPPGNVGRGKEVSLCSWADWQPRGLGCCHCARTPASPPAFQAVLLEIQDAVAQAGQVVREAVGGLKTVRSFGAEEHEACRYEEALERCRKLWWQRDLERALYLLFRRVSRLSGLGAGLGPEGTGGDGRRLSQTRLPSPSQMLHLAMQVLMLSCGLQQILAGDLTRGGLLSFLLFQEDLGHHVQVRQQPRMLSLSLCFSLWPLRLGIYWFSLKTQDKTKSQLIVL